MINYEGVTRKGAEWDRRKATMERGAGARASKGHAMNVPPRVVETRPLEKLRVCHRLCVDEILRNFDFGL